MKGVLWQGFWSQSSWYDTSGGLEYHAFPLAKAFSVLTGSSILMSIRKFFLLLLPLSLLACASGPKTNTSFRDATINGAYEDVLVIVLSVTGIEMFRDQAEKTLVQRLENLKVGAIPRSQLFRSSEELTRELVLERIAKSDVDAVLVVVGGAIKFSDRGPETYINTRGGYGDYSNSVGNAFIFQSPVPNQRMDNLDVNIISNLYDVKTQKRIWSATTTMKNPGSKMEIIAKVSEKIIKAMQQQDLI
jgi:hypothetical protein